MRRTTRPWWRGIRDPTRGAPRLSREQQPVRSDRVFSELAPLFSEAEAVFPACENKTPNTVHQKK